MQFLFTKEGELCENVRKALRDSWSELEFSATLTQLDGGWNLFYLGEAADYLLGASASRRQWQSKEPPAEMKEFEAKLQVGKMLGCATGLEPSLGLGERSASNVRMALVALFRPVLGSPVLRAAQLCCVYRNSLGCAHAHP